MKWYKKNHDDFEKYKILDSFAKFWKVFVVLMIF